MRSDAARLCLVALVCGLLRAVSAADEPSLGVAPLVVARPDSIAQQSGTLLLDDPATIEEFLTTLDGTPPNWAEVYGADGVGHDERLFALNRERDAARALRRRAVPSLMFFWSGELSRDDPDTGGFHVAVGPRLVETSWGVVRFKPDDLPGTLIAIAGEELRARLGNSLIHQEVIIAITGHLIEEESVIYDFMHDQPGRGMVMPVVHVESVRYFLQDREVKDVTIHRDRR